MKQALVLAIAIAASGLACSAEDRICRRMGDLCGTQSEECRESVTATRHAQGDTGVEALAKCYAEAESCAGARGCEAALAMKGAASAVGEFLDAFGKGIEDEDERE